MNSRTISRHEHHDDDCFYYHSWRNTVVIAFGTLSSLTVGLTDDTPLPVDMKTSKCRQDYDHAKDMARKVLHRHQAAADHMAAVQVRLGQVLAKRVTPACN